MKVEIAVVGQSIVYFKDSVWNVVFITDDCHKVLFCADPPDSTTPKYEELAKKTVPRIIAFTAGKATPATSPSGTAALDQLLNLSEAYLHGVDQIPSPSGDRRSNLLVKPQSLDGRQYIHMTIPYGALTATGPDSGTPDYFIEKYNSGLPQSLGRSVASGIEIDIDLDDRSELTMMTFDSENGPDYSRKYSGGQAHRLVFNNDCAVQDPDYNDFLNIYDWLSDKPSGGTLKFVTGKLWTVGMNHPKSLTGGCDPVVIEPPPWP